MTATLAAELEALAGAVRRLRPDWRNAEAFYELRSEIAGALMRLARQPAPVHSAVLAPARPRAAIPPQPLTITRYVVTAAPSPPLRAARPSRRLRRHRDPRPPAACAAQSVLDLGAIA